MEQHYFVDCNQFKVNPIIQTIRYMNRTIENSPNQCKLKGHYYQIPTHIYIAGTDTSVISLKNGLVIDRLDHDIGNITVHMDLIDGYQLADLRLIRNIIDNIFHHIKKQTSSFDSTSLELIIISEDKTFYRVMIFVLHRLVLILPVQFLSKILQIKFVKKCENEIKYNTRELMKKHFNVTPHLSHIIGFYRYDWYGDDFKFFPMCSTRSRSSNHTKDLAIIPPQFRDKPFEPLDKQKEIIRIWCDRIKYDPYPHNSKQNIMPRRILYVMSQWINYCSDIDTLKAVYDTRENSSDEGYDSLTFFRYHDKSVLTCSKETLGYIFGTKKECINIYESDREYDVHLICAELKRLSILRFTFEIDVTILIHFRNSGYHKKTLNLYRNVFHSLRNEYREKQINLHIKIVDRCNISSVIKLDDVTIRDITLPLCEFPHVRIIDDISLS